MRPLVRALVATPAVAAAVASAFVFSDRSKLNLKDVHPDLQAIAHKCLDRSPVDFVVIDGMRTEEEHKRNVANGRSWTLRSRHQDGKAIDVAAFVNGKITFTITYYYRIADACKAASKELGIPIIWGGDWKQKDFGHFELDGRKYP